MYNTVGSRVTESPSTAREIRVDEACVTPHRILGLNIDPVGVHVDATFISYQTK